MERKVNQPERTALAIALSVALALLLLLLAAGNVCAQQASICRIYNQLPGGKNDIGSGTLADKADDGSVGLVLTCFHLFDEGVGTIYLKFPDGSSHGGRIVDTDKESDLAAIAIKNPTAPATGIGKPDGIYTCAGYGGSGTYRQYTGKRTSDNWRNSFAIFGEARSGDSGGPVLNSKGELVSVLWGTAGGETFASKHDRFVKFCQGFNVCYGGQCQQGRVVVGRPAPRQQPTQPPTVCKCANAIKNLETRITHLEKEIAVLQERSILIDEDDLAQRIQSQIIVPPGPPGPPGRDGKDGESFAVSPQEMAAQLAPYLTHSALLRFDTGETKLQTKPLSEPLEFLRRDN